MACATLPGRTNPGSPERFPEPGEGAIGACFRAGRGQEQAGVRSHIEHPAGLIYGVL